MRFAPSEPASFTETTPPRPTKRVPLAPSGKPRKHQGKSPSFHRSINVLFVLVAVILAVLYAVAEILIIPHAATFKAGALSKHLALPTFISTLFSPRESLGEVCSRPPNVEQVVEAIVRKALRGPVLRRDFVLKADGGKIIPQLTADASKGSRVAAEETTSFSPDIILEDGLTIGRCWNATVPAQVGLSSSSLIHPTNVTIDHIPAELAADIGTAPRRMILWGMVEGGINLFRYKTFSVVEKSKGVSGRYGPSISGDQATFLSLAVFDYSISADFHIQTFPIFEHVVQSRMDFGVFVLEILDSWGAKNVCIYRVRVHGEPAVRSSTPPYV